MREMHLLNKATVMLAVLVITPFAIWISNRKDRKLQDMEDELILGDKRSHPRDGERSPDGSDGN